MIAARGINSDSWHLLWDDETALTLCGRTIYGHYVKARDGNASCKRCVARRRELSDTEPCPDSRKQLTDALMKKESVLQYLVSIRETAQRVRTAARERRNLRDPGLADYLEGAVTDIEQYLEDCEEALRRMG